MPYRDCIQHLEARETWHSHANTMHDILLPTAWISRVRADARAPLKYVTGACTRGPVLGSQQPHAFVLGCCHEDEIIYRNVFERSEGMSVIEASMLGACPNRSVMQMHSLITSLIVTNREPYKYREIGLIAGKAKEETRVYLRCNLSQVRSSLWAQ
jgi:hypothetical protein